MKFLGDFVMFSPLLAKKLSHMVKWVHTHTHTHTHTHLQIQYNVPMCVCKYVPKRTVIPMFAQRY